MGTSRTGYQAPVPDPFRHRVVYLTTNVYLRGWDDYERYPLQLTASKTSGLGHAAFSTRSPQALKRRVAALRPAIELALRHLAEQGLLPAPRRE